MKRTSVPRQFAFKPHCATDANCIGLSEPRLPQCCDKAGLHFSIAKGKPSAISLINR
jgi:hypothetical protein